MTRRPRARRSTTLADEQLALAWHSAARLLGYPTDDLLTQLEPLHRVTHVLPDPVGGPLRSTVVHLERAPLSQLQDEYVATFDADLDPSDHLCAVLEWAATTDVVTGRHLLWRRRDDLDRLLLTLQGKESGWVGAVQAVTATLPLIVPVGPALGSAVDA